MTAQEEAKFLRQVDEIHAIVTKQIGGGLVEDGQRHAQAPTDAPQNPGKYYGTQYDPMEGSVISTQVIDQFSPPMDDGEGGVARKFVGGTLYDWARADIAGFMRYYEWRYKTPLVIARLHPEQRKAMGLLLGLF